VKLTKVNLTNLLLAGLMILPAACWAQESAPPVKTTRPGLAPGDQVQVHMYDFPDLGGPVTAHVALDGSVHLPYAGTIQVAGMSPDAFQLAVGQALRNRGIVKDPNVTVDVVTAVNMTVDVIGMVQSPRAVPLYAPAPLSYILSLVGGMNGYAAHHFTIIHPDDEVPTSLDYDPDAPTVEVLHTLVQPGDIVHVASRGVYFVAGEVGHPGIFPIGGGLSIGQATATSGTGVVKQLTLLEALAQAGGLSPIAARSKMRILRTIDGKREEIIVDQVKLYKGEIADPIIHPDDIIYVPTSYLRQQTNNLFSTALSSLYAVTELKSVTQ
jgi:polysaccharide biosynthesis/export protein